MNYLIDEGMSIGKGGNCVIGLLHHFLSTHGLGEKNLRLHTDNCSGQNKNRFVDTLISFQRNNSHNSTSQICNAVSGMEGVSRAEQEN